MSEIQPLPKKAKKFSLRGFFKALGESPAQLLPTLGFKPKIGKLGIGGNVVMKDGTTVQVERDQGTPNPGEKVIVHDQGENF